MKKNNLSFNGGICINLDYCKCQEDVLHAIQNPVRLQILKAIDKGSPCSVSTIYRKLRIDQTVTSMHLSVLRKANLVHFTKVGTRKFYSINNETMKGIQYLSQIFNEAHVAQTKE